MIRLVQVSIAILSLGLVACANQPKAGSPDIEVQMSIINQWHQCVDNNLKNTQSADIAISATEAIQHTLIACQGHREDVLATFPAHLQQGLAKIMVEQTHEAGYALFVAKNGIPLPVTSVTFDTLGIQN